MFTFTEKEARILSGQFLQSIIDRLQVKVGEAKDEHYSNIENALRYEISILEKYEPSQEIVKRFSKPLTEMLTNFYKRILYKGGNTTAIEQVIDEVYVSMGFIEVKE